MAGAMRVMFTSLPAIGHFNSLLPLAEAVIAAGHEAAICTSRSFSDEAAAIGLQLLPGGAATFEALLDGAPARRDRRRAVWTQRTVFGTRAPQRLIPDLLRHVAAWQPDVIVRESAEYGGCLVAEKLDLPHASVATGSTGSQDDRPRLLRGVLGERRAELGLEADPDGRMMFRYLHLALTPRRWEGRSEPPATAHFFRYEDPHRSREEAPGWLARPRQRPLVLASLGTLMYREPGLLEAIVAALADEPLDAVVVIGDEDPRRFGAVAANIRLERRIPQIAILRHCQLFITHGGFNGTKEALSLGVPLVVIPIGGDQPFTAERVKALGLGLAVAPPDRTPEIIRARLREVLENPAYREHAQQFAAEMRWLPPLSDAVELLERLATERQPILRSR
jgi:UDP:flavonoid glycosyltransferase YjiC (YdhE family)